MKKINVLYVSFFILLLLLSFNLICSEKINKVDKKVLEAVEKEGKTKVIVLLKDLNSYGDEKKSVIKQQVANKMNGKKITKEFSSFNGFSASLTKREIEELSNDASVDKIYYDNPVHAFLQDSVPQINATLVWPIQISGINLTGKGETICIIDTGINYTHPALGNCNIFNLSLSGNQLNLTPPVQSAHNYGNNFNYTWKINQTGFSKIAVHFLNISTEYDYDFVDVLDSNYSLIASYSGVHNDVWSPNVEGDTLYVRLTSDEFVTSYGFYLDKIVNGTTNSTYNWSACKKVIGGWDVYNSDPDPMDDEGHGTHVAGIVAANGSIKGVAPESNIFAVKVFPSVGDTTDSNIIKGIEWCTNNSEKYNISVISMSLGGGLYSNYCDSSLPLYSSAINSATAKNISVIVAAGNGLNNVGPGNSTAIAAPACIQNAIPVSSVTKSDSIDTSYADRNWMVRLFAYGTNINSTYLSSSGYARLSGTSMATPHVAGAFAIVNQYLKLTGRTRTPQEIESIFVTTGKIIVDPSNLSQNFSRIDLYGAIHYIQTFPTYTNNVSYGESFRYTNFTTNITFNDNYGLDSAWLESNHTRNLVNYTYVLSGIEANLSKSFNLTTNYSSFSYRWHVNNSFGNLNSTSWQYVNIVNTPPTNLTIPELNWTTNSNLTLNLSQYFSDLDGDSLIFSNISVSNVSIIINQTNSIVTLIPQVNFNGTRYLVFYANDSINTTASNNVTLNIFRPIIIINTSTFNGSTTNFSNLTSFLNLPIIIEEINFGKINFSSVTLNSSSIDIDSNVNISLNRIEINSSVLSCFNVSANLTFYNINLTYPVIYKDGNSTYCVSYCSVLNSSNLTYLVQVPGFSVYDLREASCGDGICNAGESCSSCSVDCGACSSNSPGGGGGSSSSKEYKITEAQLLDGYSQKLNSKDKISFTILSKSHVLTLNQLSSNYANMTLTSSPINMLLSIGEEKRFNLTNADYYDLFVRLNNISSGKANITIKEIKDNIIILKPVVKNNTFENINKTFEDEKVSENLKSNYRDYLFFIIVGSILFIFIIIFLILKSKVLKTIENTDNEIRNSNKKRKNKITQKATKSFALAIQAF